MVYQGHWNSSDSGGGPGVLLEESTSRVAEFYKDRGVLITGASGFVGKILVEKLLRSCPGIKNVYVLIRSKDGLDSRQRLDELLSSQIFDKLKRDNPSALTKVIPINGDILQPGLGICQSDLSVLINNASVVYHSAATVKFDEPLRRAVDINVLGTRRVLELCHKLNQIAAFVHVSTAYCFCNKDTINEVVYPEHIPYQKVIDATEWMDEKLLAQVQPQVLNGRPSTYHYTKALAENLLVHEGGNLPIVILRPSIITSAWKEPIPGWVDNYNGPAGFVIATGKGVLRTMVVYPESAADIYPVDLVTNLMIVSAWHADKAKLTNTFVVNCTSGPMRHLTWQQIYDYAKPLVLKYPSNEIFRYPGGSFKTSRFWNRVAMSFDHNLPAHLVDLLCRLFGQKPFLGNVYERIHRAMGILEFFTTHEWTFTADNLKMLMNELSEKDRQVFDFDIRPIDWLPYLEDYILGVRKFVLKEDPSTIPAAKRKLSSTAVKAAPKKPASWTDMCSKASEPAERIYYLGQLTHLVILAGMVRLLIKHSKTFNHLWWSLITRILQIGIQVSMAIRST